MFEQIQVCQKHDFQIKNQHIKSYKIFLIKPTVFILCKVSVKWKQKSFVLYKEGCQYICHLQKQQLSGNYKQSLEQLIRNVDFASVLSIQNYWFGLYKIYSFPAKIIKSYSISDAAYGEEVVIAQRKNKIIKVVSNCYKQNGVYFYFLNHEGQQENHQLSYVLNIEQDKIFGFGIKIGKMFLCLPISVLISDQPSIFKIVPRVQHSIKRVVFVSYESNHCTGILFSSCFIITVRHLFNSLSPQIGTMIKIRTYPYKYSKKARVVKTFPSFIDLVILQAIDQNQQFNRIVQSMQALEVAPSIQLGTKIYAIGFGKYRYQDYLFDQIDLLMPTITFGIVSKIINYSNRVIFFKTDSYLYNGYSGCPIWHEGSWIGNSVFIIKNAVSSNKHPNHNFNYSLSFIRQVLTKNNMNSGVYQQFMRQFDQINARKHLRIKSRL